LDPTRTAATRALANQGRLQTRAPDRDVQQAWEAELQQSLTPEQRTRQEASQSAQRQSSTPLGGRTLAEARTIAGAQASAQRAQQRQAASSGRVVKRGEEERYEARIEAWTSQGYARHDAEWRVEFQDRQRARQQR
jgi:hypothetical protein